MVHPLQRAPGQVVDAFVQCALDAKPLAYLPGRVEVCGPEVAEVVRQALSPLGIEVVARERLAGIENLLQELEKDLGKGLVIPGVLEPPGMTVERVASFAEAARLFYEATPWRHLSNEDLLRIEAPAGPPDLRHALVMGSGGDEFGLLFFGPASFYERILDKENAQDDFERETLCNVYFGPITEMPLADSALFEDHHLPVAGPQAFPWVARTVPDRRIRRPAPRALAHVEAVLRALAATTETELDQGRWTRIVSTAEGALPVTLTLPALVDPPEVHTRSPRPLMDRRAMERTMAEVQRFLRGRLSESIEEINAEVAREFGNRRIDEIPSTASTPLEKAQDLCFEAFEARGRRQVLLARQALETCPDCADAYVILAERTGDPEEAMRLYGEGVTAGERALGPARFTESDAPFWSDMVTRPFMRALQGLAETCAHMGRNDEAVGHYQRLLRLNPNDNQGVRELLAGVLLRTRRHDELRALIDQYPSELEATLLYADALLRFRTEGDSAGSRKALRAAVKANPHIPRILLKKLPVGTLPSSYSLGSREEAMSVASDLEGTWAETPGALDWLKEHSAPSHAPKGKRRRIPGTPRVSPAQ